jgi:hypothetical protein
VLLDLTQAQCDILLACNVGRSRHLLTRGGARAAARRGRSPAGCAADAAAPAHGCSAAAGAQKRARVQAYKAERHTRIAVAFCRMSAAVEEMKTGASLLRRRRRARARHGAPSR